MNKTPLPVRLLLSVSLLAAPAALWAADVRKSPGCGDIACKDITPKVALAAVDTLIARIDANIKESKDLKDDGGYSDAGLLRERRESMMQLGLALPYASEYDLRELDYKSYKNAAQLLAVKHKFWDTVNAVLLAERKKFDDDKPAKELEEGAVKKRVADTKEAYRLSIKTSLTAAVQGDLISDEKFLKELMRGGLDDKGVASSRNDLVKRKVEFFKGLKESAKKAK